VEATLNRIARVKETTAHRVVVVVVMVQTLQEVLVHLGKVTMGRMV
jgi:hypothetical protein